MFSARFVITNQILKNIGIIEAAREIIDDAVMVPAWEAKFREDAVVRTVHYGTHVEGNDLSLMDAEKLIRQDPQRDELASEVAQRAGVVARDRDVQEVINYRNVLRYLDQLVMGYRANIKANPNFRFRYTQDQFLQIHALSVEKMVNPAEVGMFRKTQVVVRGLHKGEVVHRPPNAVEVPYQIEDFYGWLNGPVAKELHPVLKAAVSHLELARIHPFTEGNGRTARAISLLILAIEGIDARRFFSMEEHFDKNIEEYYRAFEVVSREGGDMTSWLSFFCDALAIEMNKIKERVKRLSMDSRLKEKVGGKQIALTERQIRLIEYLELNNWMSMPEAAQVLPMVSDDTILRDLKDLMKKGLVKKKGRTKGSVYALRR